jgi:hypothetical protein
MITDSFQMQNSLSATVAFAGNSIGSSYGLTYSTQDQVSEEEKLTSNSGIKYTGPSTNGIDHDGDAIFLWLNPRVNLALTTSDMLWWTGTRNNDPAVIVYVYVGWLKNPSTMPQDVFRQLVNTGITIADYPKILAHDPFAANPSQPLDTARFIPTNTSFPYEPPLNPQGTPPVLSYSQSTSDTTTSLHSVENSDTVGITGSGGFALSDAVGLTLKDSVSFTWTSKSATGKSSSDAQTASLTIAGPSYGYIGPTQFDVYWEGLYGAFAFVPRSAPPIVGGGQQKPSVSIGTVTGSVFKPDGTPPHLQEVVLRDANGETHRTFTDYKGSFEFPRSRSVTRKSRPPPFNSRSL